jgi:phosphopantetheinyl transferase
VLRSHEDGPQQASFFFALWTLKEALLKGLGTGLLGDNLSRVDMHRALTEDGPDPLMYSEGGGKRVWAMHPLPAPEGYAAALAVEGGGATLHFFEWLTAEDDCRDNSVGVPSSFGNVGRINHA